MALNDLQAGIIQRSYDFFPGANFGVDDSVTAGAPRHLDIDELTMTIPFESYDRDPSQPATPSRPFTWAGSTEDSTPAYLPNQSTTGAGWFGAGSTVAGLNFSLQEAVSADYETATFQRIGSYFDLDRYQKTLSPVGGARTRGPDLKETLIRMATLATVRELGRYIVNSPGSTPGMRGLAGYYDGQFGGTGLDPQVLPSTSTDNTSLLSDIRTLLRQVAPSGTGFGQGANALVMSRRTRDAVIRASIVAGMHLDSVRVATATPACSISAFRSTSLPFVRTK